MEKIILTQEGKKELERRLNELKNELIPAVVQRIQTARELGDLSENAEYHAAKDEQGKLEGEKLDIEAKLKYGVVVESSKQKDRIDVGSKFKYLDLEENEEYTFTIVGTAEADLSKGKISNESPLGIALMGKKVGDTCKVVTPKGSSYKVKVLEILE